MKQNFAFHKVIIYLILHRNGTNRNSFKIFLWNGTIYFSNLDALNIFNGIQAIALNNLLGEIESVLFVINIECYFSLIAIDNSTCSIKKRSPKNNRHIIIFRHFKHNKISYNYAIMSNLNRNILTYTNMNSS